MKLDGNAELQWSNVIGGDNLDVSTRIIETKDKGYLLAGYSNSNVGDLSPTNGLDDIWLIKFDFNGKLSWSKRFGGSKSDIARDIIQNENGEFVVVGKSRSSDFDFSRNEGIDDFMIIKLGREKYISRDTIDGTFSIKPVDFSGRDIDLGEAIAGTYKDSYFDNFIINNGGFPVSIDTIYFEGGDASEFSCFGKVYPVVIQQGQNRKV
jgi:hypothetical protein